MPSTAQSGRVPAGVDPNRASIARVYDAALGGGDNYEIDRDVLQRIAVTTPEVNDFAVVNRAFLIRVCRFLATQTGIGQFLDCGSGLPTAENVHQVVQRLDPERRVVYIDNDPVVLAHGRALLEENEHTALMSADIFDSQEVLEHPVVGKHIDFSEPVAFLQLASLHHYEGSREGPGQIMKEYIDALAPGSCVVISHFLDPENEYTEVARNVEDHLRNSPLGSGTFRTKAEIEELFDGLELLEPGVTLCADWWPDGPRLKELNPAEHCVAGGVAFKR